MVVLVVLAVQVVVVVLVALCSQLFLSYKLSIRLRLVLVGQRTLAGETVLADLFGNQPKRQGRAA